MKLHLMTWSKCLLPLVLAIMVSASVSEAASVKEELANFVEGRLPPEQLTITYSDLHGLWGGLEMVVEGTGKVTQQAVQVKAHPARALDRGEVLQLVRLLIRMEMWKQKVPDRTPLADEARAYLKIQAGKSSAEIWEWYNDLEKNNRLIQVSKLMKKLAWSTE